MAAKAVSLISMYKDEKYLAFADFSPTDLNASLGILRHTRMHEVYGFKMNYNHN
jgi:hypothetical protein